MIITLDTNIFFGNWYLRKASFKYLAYFANNDGHEIWLSELVIQELDALWRRKTAEFEKQITTLLTQASPLFSDMTPIKLEQISAAQYSSEVILSQMIANLRIIGYENVSQRDLVDRAVNQIRPFREKDKGYRDTLIWLSLVNLLSEQQEALEVAFISNNKSEFYETINDGIQFHERLREDLASISKHTVTPYLSLSEFVASKVDKNLHCIDVNKHGSHIEEEVEWLSKEHFSGMNKSSLQKIFGLDRFGDHFHSIIVDVEVEIYEGMEDPEFRSMEFINDDDVFVNYAYNIRGFALLIVIPNDFYYFQQTKFDGFFDNVEIGPEIATLSLYSRPEFEVGFIFNSPTAEIRNFEVNSLKV